MDTKELARYEKSNLKIDEGRVLTYSNMACPLNCKYCFANEIIRGHENEKGNFMTFSVSIACTDSKGRWEPKVPSVESRIETLRKVSNLGIDTMVAVRPLIPGVSEQELEDIVDKTKDYVCGYYSGPMYLKRLGEETITADELALFGCIISEDIEEVHWMPEGNSFLRVETPKLMSYLQTKVEQSGKMFFEGAADGMDYLRRNRYAKP
jgi:hypothetical protein